VQAAARLNDPIAHSSAIDGLIGGAIAGAVIGASLALGVALIIGTGGLAAPLLFGGMLAGGATGSWIGEFVGSLSFFDNIAGHIATGSPNVFVNFKPLARAQVDTGECSKHGPQPPQIATGSSSVFINGFPAARVDDKLGCSGFIIEGSPDVFIGGGQVQSKSVEIEPEVSWEVHALVIGSGVVGALLLGGWAVIPGLVGGFAVGYLSGEVMGWVGRQTGEWLSENIGGVPSDWEKAGTFVGQALGGWLGGRGGSKARELARTVEVEPNSLRMNGAEIPVRARQEPLVTKEMDPFFKGEEIPNNRNNWLTGRSTVEYLNDAQRAELLLTIKDGKLYDAKGNLFDTIGVWIDHRAPRSAIYVMDENGNFYASIDHKRGEFHHSSILGGRPVAGAGEIEVNRGVLQYINRGSGHYEPTPEMLQQTVNELRARGLEFEDWAIDSGW
jgi:uncharacterized Zn-binding protein involved in type VI secretion